MAEAPRMTLSGITDSVASLFTAPPVCSRCGCAARLKGGECLSCLLEAGIETPEPHNSDPFAAVLAEVDVRDIYWRFGNYQTLEDIGRAGVAVIYRARHRHSRRIVALKRVLSY